MISVDFWQNKKVLVTGHTGFKGSWLTFWLQTMGAEAVGLALKPDEDQKLFALLKLNESIKNYFIDIRDRKPVAEAISNINPDIVIHMAAQPLVRYSYEFPIETYETNVLGTAHVLEAIKQCSRTKVVVSVTTDKCYENNASGKDFVETDPLGGYDPYSNSKACAELVTQSYRDSFLREKGIYVATARAGNVIGGGDWSKDRLIPDAIRAWQNNETLEIRNPDSTRPWQHVLEPLSGYLCLAERLWHRGDAFAQGWNFGPFPEDVQPVGWIIDQVVAMTGDKLNWAQDKLKHVHEAPLLQLDITKAQSHLNWAPKWDLLAALQKTYHWYDAFYKGSDMLQETKSQIDQYWRVD